MSATSCRKQVGSPRWRRYDRLVRVSVGRHEGVDGLAEEPFGYGGSAADTVGLGPAVFGQVEGPEEVIEKWQVHGEILIDGFALGAVVPVVELRGGEEVAQ